MRLILLLLAVILLRLVGNQSLTAIPLAARRSWNGVAGWRALARDLVVWGAPWVLWWVAIILALGRPAAWFLPLSSMAKLSPLLAGAGVIAWFLRNRRRYPDGFAAAPVAEILARTDASEMHAVPVLLRGIVAEPAAGNDSLAPMMFEDDTGKVGISYGRGLPWVPFWFKRKTGDQLNGKRVRLQGWYRSSWHDYVDVDSIHLESGESVVSSSPAEILKNIFGLAMTLLCLILWWLK